MKVESIDIKKLTADPANVRQHSEKNLAAIKASLKRFGQQKPIVIDADGLVRAGNGTLAAAQLLGWKKINIVRSKLAGSEMTAFAIADNRTAELANWDDDALKSQLESLASDGIDLSDLGFDKKDLGRLTGAEASDAMDGIDDKYEVVIECVDEAEQRELFERLAKEGKNCRVLTI